MTPMIEAAGVVKRFGKTTALDGLELFAEQGVILAVLGPNGPRRWRASRGVARSSSELLHRPVVDVVGRHRSGVRADRDRPLPARAMISLLHTRGMGQGGQT